MIEDELHKDALRITYDGFEEDFACFEDRCEPRIKFNDEKEISEITFSMRRPEGLVSGGRRYSDQPCIARLLKSQEEHGPVSWAELSRALLETNCYNCYSVRHRALTHEELVAQALVIHRNHLHQPLRRKMRHWLEVVFTDVFSNDVGEVRLVHACLDFADTSCRFYAKTSVLKSD